MKLAMIGLLLVVPLLAAQNPSAGTADNPLAVLKDELERVLAEARLPFTQEQENAIVLMMEERRQASEDLFGDLMDFRSGPTQGQEADRLRSAIEWMRNEFVVRVQEYLTPEQLAVWNRYRETNAVTEAPASEAARAPRPQTQTQYVRINNNVFTAEDGTYRFGQGGGGAQRTEVIQRGGAGEFHGNAELLLKDEALNARNPFAVNKPPYQERQASFDISGPVIPGRMTTTFEATQNEAENVDTIHATLPDGLFTLGITKPTVTRSFQVRNTYQFSDAHSLSFNLLYGTDARDNQGIGGFTVEERASTVRGNNWNVEFRQFSSFSAQTIYETRLSISGRHTETTPVTEATRINVLDAFNTGGAQNASEASTRTYDFSNLFSRLGERMTVKAGLEGAYRIEESLSKGNFGGTYTFSNLNAYLEGRPLNYRVVQGEPLLKTRQLELSLFLQNDWKLSPRLTAMFGGRYDAQTNLSDYNNFGPRAGFAYAIGQATVLRWGGGIFYNRLTTDILTAHRRLDGTRQVEIVVDSPSYPDPFLSGTIRNTLPTVRVTDPTLVAPYISVGMVSLERTFLTNLFLSVTYDYTHEVHRFRSRNLNAPRDITSPYPRSCTPTQSIETCVRPQSDRGNILNLESTGNEIRKNLRFTFRQRFSIFNVNASYTLASIHSDARPNAIEDLPTDNYDLKSDWTRVTTPPHTFNSTVNARMPLGVFLTGSVSTTSGRLYGVTTGRDDNRDTVVNDRPPGLARFSAVGPGSLSFNFNISKAFFLEGPTGNGGGTRRNLNLFANMTNAFNRLNYGVPSGVMTSPNFGKSTSAVNPREIEVGMRFQF